MPALLSHYLHSKLIGTYLDSKNIEVDTEAFYYGAQGPDFLFYHRATPWQKGKSLRKYGSLIHRQNPELIFRPMLHYLEKHSGIKERSYVMGFICHYSFDRTAHPYVYSMQEKIIQEEKVRYNPFFVHNRIEYNLDVILLRNFAEAMATEINPGKLFSGSPQTITPISKLMYYVFESAFGKKISEKSVYQGFVDLQVNSSHLNDSTGIKRKIISGIEKIFRTGPALSAMIRPIREDIDWDYANLSRSLWQSPAKPGVVRYDTFFNIYEQAEKDSKMLIDGFLALSSEDFLVLTERRSYNTGEPVDTIEPDFDTLFKQRNDNKWKK